MKKIMMLGVAVLAFSAWADYYVNPDPTKGSDSYDGSQPVWDGTGTKGPKLTIKEALKLASSGHVVHCARGVYGEAEGYTEGTYGKSRVTINSGVKLVADEGPEVTAIEGRLCDTANRCGDDAIRCVFMTAEDDGASCVRGFTLRNGATKDENTSSGRGGAVHGNYSKGGVVVDCVISNCWGNNNGGGVYLARTLRCRFTDLHSKNDSTYPIHSVVAADASLMSAS